MNSYFSRIKIQMDIAERILKENGIEVIQVNAFGETFLSEIFSLIYLGDFISYYLALLYKEDPTPIRYTDMIKKELSKSFHN